MTTRRKPSRRPPPREEPKRDTTRRLILERALALFRERGVEGTTMRDVARAAGLSLGAAYYHFASKEALIFAYYEGNQAEVEARVASYPTGEPLRARLSRLLHDKLETIADNRKMLGAIVQRLANPTDPVSAFSAETRAVRERAVALYEAALAGEAIPDGTRRLLAQALWLLHLGLMLYFVHDDSPAQQRSHRLVDDALDLLLPLLPLFGSDFAAPFLGQLTALLERAGLRVTPLAAATTPSPA